MPPEEQLLKDLLVLLQPTRWKIIKTLKEAGRPMYIREIADAIGEDWKVVAFHLSALAKAGFVEYEWKIIESPKKNPGRGRIAKFYRVTKKVDEVLSRVNELQL